MCSFFCLVQFLFCTRSLGPCSTSGAFLNALIAPPSLCVATRSFVPPISPPFFRRLDCQTFLGFRGPPAFLFSKASPSPFFGCNLVRRLCFPSTCVDFDTPYNSFSKTLKRCSFLSLFGDPVRVLPSGKCTV